MSTIRSLVLAFVVLCFAGNLVHAKLDPNGWGPAQPYQTDPAKDALDLGRIPNKANPPSNDEDWIVRTNDLQRLNKHTMELWYKFTGDAYKCYFIRLSDIDASSRYFPARITFFESSKDKPEPNSAQYLETDDIDMFDAGCYFQNKGGAQKNKTYFIRIQAHQSYYKEKASFYIHLHETMAAPRPGTLQNPYWAMGQARLGQWSMDISAAVSPAYSQGKPVALYFTGAFWDPDSIRLEHTIFSDGNVIKQLDKTFPILLDNTETKDRGPSFLKDYIRGGYLDSYGISDAAAEQQLKINREMTTDFARPNEDKITYPTLIYCRVIPADRYHFTLDPVSRCGSELRTSDQAEQVLNNLNLLFRNGHREISQFHKTSKLAINPNAQSGSHDFFFGEPASTLWVKFTANSRSHAGQAWLFSASALKASKNTILNLEVYDSTGSSLLQAETAALPETPQLLFQPETSSETTYWLKISSPNFSKVETLTLDYRQTTIGGELTLPQKNIHTDRTQNWVKIPLKLQIHDAETATFAFEYRVVKIAGAGAAPESFFQPTDWTFYSLNANHADTSLSLPLRVPSTTEDWNGIKSFKVEFRNTYNGNCLVKDTLATVNILARPAFLTLPPKDNQLFQGLATDLTFPIYSTPDTSVILKGQLPEGLKIDDSFLHDNLNPRLKISGIPTKPTEKPLNITLSLAKGGYASTQSPHSADMTFTVTAVDIPAADTQAFTGLLKTSNANQLAGSITIRKQEQAFDLTVQTEDRQTPLNASVNGWSSYDPKKKLLIMDTILPDTSSLHLSVGELGLGQATLTRNGQVLKADILPLSKSLQLFPARYTVICHDDQNRSRAWLTLSVDQQGNASGTLQLMEPNVTANATSIISDDKTENCLDLVFLINWNGQRHDGFMHASLTVSADGRQLKAHLPNVLTLNQQSMPLSPRGTLFDSNQTIKEATAEDYLIAVIDTPAQAFMPKVITLKESEAFTLTPASSQGILAMYLKPLKISPTDGTFTATATMLHPQKNASVTKTDITIKGIMITGSTPEGLPMGYGFFTYPTQGKPFRMNLLPNSKHTFAQLQEPNVSDIAFDQNNVYGTCQSNDNALLCQSRNGEIRILTETRMTLPRAGNPWKLSAIPNESTQRESRQISLPEIRTQRIDLQPDATGTTVTSGWNLVAIPTTMVIQDNTTFITTDGKRLTSFQYDEQHQLLTATKFLKPGLAYWLYLPDATPVSFTFSYMDNPHALPSELPSTWGLRACPTTIHNLVIWQYRDRRYQLVTDPSALKRNEGVWIYRK